MERLKCEYCNGDGRKKERILIRGSFELETQTEWGWQIVECPKCKGTGECDWVTNAVGPTGKGRILEQTLIL